MFFAPAIFVRTDGLYRHCVRRRGFGTAYRIMPENGVKPTGGELPITVE